MSRSSCSRTTARCRSKPPEQESSSWVRLPSRPACCSATTTAFPTHTVSILEGLKQEFAGDSINFVEGTGFLSKHTQPVPNALLSIDGKPGVKATYLNQNIVSFYVEHTKKTAALATRIEPGIDIAAQPLPAGAAKADPLTVHWETTLTPTESGEYNLGVETDGFFRVFLDGKPVTMANYPHGVETVTGKAHLESGKPYKLEVDYQKTANAAPHLKLVWGKIDRSVDPAVVAAAQNADVVVAVVGITSELEGEELKNVNEPGFKGGDRTSLDLPEPEQKLLESPRGHRQAAGGGAHQRQRPGRELGQCARQRHPRCVVSRRGGWNRGGANPLRHEQPRRPLARHVLQRCSQLPPFEDYSMKGRTYRYFTGTPLYPFGYGLSYTKFSYSNLTVPTSVVEAGQPEVVEATVTNTGTRAGDEVAQLYLEFPAVPGAPLRALRGFERVHLEPGASQTVHFEFEAARPEHGD